MEVKIINSSKDEIEIEIENVTIAEILRVNLNKDSNVETAVWKQEHPTKKPILFVRTKEKNPKKVISNSISQIINQLDKIEKEFKTLK